MEALGYGLLMLAIAGAVLLGWSTKRDIERWELGRWQAPD